MDERLVTIRSYSFPWEAYVDRSVLQEEGIPTYVADEGTSAMYSVAMGGVKLQIPESYVEEAQEILSEQDEYGTEGTDAE